MPAKLSDHPTYGKSNVRLTRVVRHPDRHELKELSVDVLLSGDFKQTYLTGDNSKVVATDSIKNTIYVLAKQHPIDSIENFGYDLMGHFLNTYPQVSRADVSVRQRAWHRMKTGPSAQPHPHAFIAGSDEVRTVSFHMPDGAFLCYSGLENLLVLKTTDSAFTGYIRDEYTTLPETSDRILATSVKAFWTHSDEGSKDTPWNQRFDQVRRTLLDTFANHKSLSVQQTLYAMGEAVLEACSDIRSIHIEMPNKHRIPFNFEPLGMKFENDVYVPTDEPFGMIEGTIVRE